MRRAASGRVEHQCGQFDALRASARQPVSSGRSGLVGETYSVKFNPAHRWYYAPEMRRDEALLLKIADTRTDIPARFMPHTSFTRELTLEIRTIPGFSDA